MNKGVALTKLECQILLEWSWSSMRTDQDEANMNHEHNIWYLKGKSEKEIEKMWLGIINKLAKGARG